MSDVLELEIVSQAESKKITIEWVEVESPSGNFIVGPDHEPLVSLLKHKGKLTYQSDGQTHSIDTYGGIFKVANDKALVVLD